MFTRDSLLKAFTDINNSKYNKEAILFEYEKDQTDPELKEFNKSLITDELIDFCNKNAEYVPTTEFGNLELLGYLGDIINSNNEFLGQCGMDEITYIRNKKAIVAGRDGIEGNVERAKECLTYIFEDGSYMTIAETLYGIHSGDDEPPLLTTRWAVDETPLLNEIDRFFPEEHQAYWDV